MDFELVGDLTAVEIITVNLAIRELTDLKARGLVVGGGESLKELQRSAWQVGPPGSPNFTGTKRMV